ncbi:MAG: hypothetical protein P8182_00900 [Deltaproteobacteria bacterium]
MRILRMVAVAALITALLASFALANGGVYKKPAAYKSSNSKNLPICEVQKPYLEYLEDGVAFILDVPFALMSPICAPIMGPIIDRLDPVEDRSFARPRSRR